MINQLKRWAARILFGKKVERQAFNLVVTDAIDLVNEKLEEDYQLQAWHTTHYSDQLYHLFMNNPYLLALIMDKDDNILEVSELWLRELGWKKQDIMDKGLFSLVHPDDIERTLQAHRDIESIIETGKFANRYLCRFKTGPSFTEDGKEWVWIEWITDTPYKNSDKYRFSLAKTVYPYDPSFAYLQSKYGTHKND